MQNQAESGREASVEFQPLNVLDECPENPVLGGTKRLSLAMLMSLGTKTSICPYSTFLKSCCWEQERLSFQTYYRFHCKLREPA
jgi:hypothetical protein